jgi:hypothetical protein
MHGLDNINNKSRVYLANHAILEQSLLCDHEGWQGWLFRVRGRPFPPIELALLISHGIDKDFPLTGVVICFTSVQIERRVIAYQSSRDS